jgi:spermidine/putrescine transport system substrate-binding protein
MQQPFPINQDEDRRAIMSIRSMCRFIIICLALSVSYPITVHAQAQLQQQLFIFNWAEYLDPELVERFESEFDAKLVQVYYSSDENRTEKLLETNGRGYDLILTSDIDLGKYLQRGWLAPIDAELLPNLKHLSPRWRQGYVGAEHYAVPFSWGTTGIVYRTDLVTKPITSWQQFFKPNAELAGRISMTGDSLDLISMALKSLGYSANSEDREQLKQVESLLLAQKPHVLSYKYLSVTEESAIIKGNVIAAMAYNSDALMMQEFNDQLTYVLPKEGGGLWIDIFAIGASARNPKLAHAFLNFINEPEKAAQQARYAFTATPNLAAEKLLPKDFLENPVIYPDQASLKNSESYKPLSPRGQRQRNSIAAHIFRRDHL